MRTSSFDTLLGPAVLHRHHLRELSRAIADSLPWAVLGDISDEEELAISSMLVRCPNGILLFVTNDMEQPARRFMVTRVSDAPAGKLLFEGEREAGLSVTGDLTREGVVWLLRQYAALHWLPTVVH